MITDVSVNFYSPDDRAEFELDLDNDETFPSSEGDRNASLTIRHLTGAEIGGTKSEARHFLSMEQLRQLRDLLNEKLPRSMGVKLYEVPETILPGTMP